MNFLSGIWAKLLAVGAIVLAVLVAIGKLLAAGRAQERADQAERETEMRRKGDEVENRVNAAGTDELERLRRRWTRPE